MAQSQTEADDALLDKIDTPVSLQQRDDDVREFVAAALKNVRGELQSNLNEAQTMTDRFEDAEVSDVLTEENVREVAVRAKPLENPKVTVWLKDCPIWANHAWRDTIYPKGLNAYNGKVTTSFDVRPF